MLALIFMTPTVTPIPKEMTCSDTIYQVGVLSLECKYSTGTSCPQHIFDNFNFFAQSAYTRATPAAVDEGDLITRVMLVIDQESEAYDAVARMPEQYNVSIFADVIQIHAQTGFAASRAFATMVQLITPHPQHEEIPSAYVAWSCFVNDKPVFPWREMMLDVSNHYFDIVPIRKLIDALAVTKQNILRLRFSDVPSYPVKHANAPQNKLNASAYDPAYAYDMDDLHDIQMYAFTRGVIVYAEIENPMKTNAWGRADPELLAKCPDNEALLNPIKQVTFDYIKGILTDFFMDGLFRDASSHPMIHLGGVTDTSCWDADPEIIQYMADNAMDSTALLKQYLVNVTDILHNMTFQKQMPHTVYASERFADVDQLDTDAIFEFTNSYEVADVIAKQRYVLQSSSWRVDEMHPGGGNYYFFADTWQSFYASDLYANVPEDKRNQVLGGAGQIFSYVISGDQMLSLTYPRAIAIAEVLWSNPVDRTPPSQRFEQLACRIASAGVSSGPMTIDRPCFGYFWDE